MIKLIDDAKNDDEAMTDVNIVLAVVHLVHHHHQPTAVHC